MTTTPRQDLTARLTDTAESGFDGRLKVPLLRLLSGGDPVLIAELAAASGRSEDDVRRALAAVPDTEFDEQGRIVGQGLTLRPTRHRFRVHDRDLYTWCALDTLIYPVLLGTTAAVESTSPSSGAPIRLTSGPEGGSGMEPGTAVLSVVNPDDLSSVRTSFCNEVDFYATADEARPWLDRHPTGVVMPVHEAHALAREMAAAFLVAADIDEA